jgi:hypothetical protein
VHSTIPPFALQEHRRRGGIVTLRSRSSTHARGVNDDVMMTVNPKNRTGSVRTDLAVAYLLQVHLKKQK